MSLPPEIQQVIDNLLQEVENDPQHYLSVDSHVALYESFASYCAIQAKRLNALERELALIEETPEFDRVDGYLRMEDAYEALTPEKNSAFEESLLRESISLRGNPELSGQVSDRIDSTPDYHELIPKIEGRHYYFICQLTILTAAYVVPVWKKVMTDASDRWTLLKMEFRERLEEWIKAYADPVTKDVINQLLADWTGKPDVEKLKANLTELPISETWKKILRLYLDGNEFEASFIVFIALGDEYPSITESSVFELLDLILFLSEKIMTKKLPIKSGHALMGTFWTMLGNIPDVYFGDYDEWADNKVKPIDDDAIRAASYAGDAALEALRCAMGKTNKFAKQVNFRSSYVEYYDASSDAAQAFAGTGKNFSVDKVLDFWKWWLTEAVPQAWEFANQLKLS